MLVLNSKDFDERVINEVKNIKGCQFVGIEYVSAVKLNKSQKAELGAESVFKAVKGRFQINYDYENAVNNRLREKGLEPVFSAQKLPWGAWVEGCFNKLIEHKGMIYLRFYGVDNGKPEVTYYIDGREATEGEAEKIKGWTEKGESGTQSASGLTEHQVVPRNVKVCNILRITMSHEDYQREGGLREAA